VLRESLGLVATGILIGTPLLLGGSRLMGTMLFGITTWDPLTGGRPAAIGRRRDPRLPPGTPRLARRFRNRTW
jgi:hypothetical protein